MNKHFIFRLSAMTTTTLLAILSNSVVVQSADEGNKGEIRLALNSAYLSTPIEIGGLKVRQLSLTGALKQTNGIGKLTLDPNSCFLNQFGDTTACTRIAPLLWKVNFKQLKIDDPNKQKRRLYSITGDGLPKRLFLVVPPSAAGPYRFILESDKNPAQVVITLE